MSFVAIEGTLGRVSATLPPDGRSRIVFGMVPQRDDEQARGLLNDLCAYLSQHTGLSVAPHRSPSSEALASALKSGRVHFAWAGALLMVLSEHMTETIPIVSSVREGVSLYHSVLFSTVDSPIRDLAGAKGKCVAWVTPSSAAGYVVPRLSLMRAGIVVSEFFSREIFAGSHANTARAAVTGQADLAATYAIFEDGDSKKSMVRSGFRTFDPALEVRILDVSGPIPGDIIVAAPSVTPEVRRLVCNALMDSNSDAASRQTIADLIGADGFTPFTAAMLREIRALERTARESGALAKG